MTDGLAACPFCGGDRARTIHIRDGRKVACTCGACGKPEFHGPLNIPDAETRAVAAWNTRPAPERPASMAADDPLQSHEKFSGVGLHDETIETRASIGERYLEVYESAINDPRLKGYTPADCPSELLLDLLNGDRIIPATMAADEGLVERVARAICESRECFDPDMLVRTPIGDHADGREHTVPYWREFESDARAAIAALAASSRDAGQVVERTGDGTCRQCGACPDSPTTGLCATCDDEDAALKGAPTDAEG